MKLLNNISLLLLGALVLFSCERDYDAPPLNEPIYNGQEANVTIAQLRTEFAAATQDSPITIDKDYVLKAYVSANDESGNIYKTIYFQDETSAISMQVDQGDVFTYYAVGQEVYIDMKGLCISVYGGEQQIGHPDGYLYRTPWDIFQEKVLLNGWANTANVQPIETSDISTFNLNPDAYKMRLVKINGVTFDNGGTLAFVNGDQTENQTLKDANGNSLTVRTSQYADFAKDMLPKGKGTVVGILGRFNGAWQLLLRTASDVYGFVEGETEETTDLVLYNETFGTPEKSGSYWPYVKDYTGFDNKDVTITDESGLASVRNNSGANIWFPAGKDITLTASGIASQGLSSATLELKLGSNVYNAGEVQELNALKVYCNDVALNVPSKETTGDNQDGNKPFTLEIPNVALSATNTLKFVSESSTNVYGIRLYGIKLYRKGSSSEEGGSTILPTPSN